MRNNWFVNVGAGRVPLAERGMLATLEALGDSLTMRQIELDEIFGAGWIPIARNLHERGMIEFGYDAPWYSMAILYRNRRRREYRREWARKRRGKV